MKKPPIGLYPRRLWEEIYPHPSDQDLEYRNQAVIEAVIRYLEIEMKVPDAWLKELMGE